MAWLPSILVDICEIENRMITLEDGTVQGFAKKSYNGRTYLAFEGIPYAKPPLNDLRFEASIRKSAL